MIGQKFNKLTVLKEDTTKKLRKHYFCKCECGNIKSIRASRIKNGETKSCGCLRQAKDLIGQKFGKLTVLKRDINLNPNGALWVCQCECGNIKSFIGGNLRNGSLNSCGCSQRDRTHGMSNTQEYKIWKGIKNRCFNKNYKFFDDYGGRGITICEEWVDSFEQFYKDIGPRPSDKYSIERIDNSGNYEPSNCKWATRTEQNRNQRSTVIKNITEANEIRNLYTKQNYSVPDLEIKYGYNKSTIKNVIYNNCWKK